MNCLTNRIGIKGCGAPVAETDLYINSLPGVTLDNIQNIADDEQENYLNIWNDVQLRAVKKMSNEVSNAFLKRYKKKSVNQTIDLTKHVDRLVDVNAEALYKGFSISTGITPRYVNSQYQVIYFTSISLYMKQAGDFTIRIFDVDTLEELYTKTVAGTTAWNIVKVDQSFTARKLFICYNATAINTYSLPILQSVGQWFNTCCNSIYGNGCNAVINGMTADLNDVSDSVSNSSESYGLSAIWSVQCVFDSVICSNKNIFDTALWYLLGAELMIERLSSDRINRWTTIDLEKATANMDYFMAVYSSEMKQAIDGIDLDVSDPCIECNQPYKIVEARM